MAVHYRCKICGKEHKSPIGFSDKETFEKNPVGSNTFSCPKTGKSATYDKKDMFWKEET